MAVLTLLYGSERRVPRQNLTALQTMEMTLLRTMQPNVFSRLNRATLKVKELTITQLQLVITKRLEGPYHAYDYGQNTEETDGARPTWGTEAAMDQSNITALNWKRRRITN